MRKNQIHSFKINVIRLIFKALMINQLFLNYSCGKSNSEEPTTWGQRIENKVINTSNENGIPSIGVEIMKKEERKTVNHKYQGQSEQEVYGLGSTTKLLSAVLVFKLIEKKQLKLTDTVVTYINNIDFIQGIENVTVFELLNHTSGISDYANNDRWFELVVEGNAPKSFQEKLQLVNNTLVDRGVFSYSNTNYLFLEKVVESITGKTYEQAFNNFYDNLDLPTIQLVESAAGEQSFFGQTIQSVFEVTEWREYHGFDGGAYASLSDLTDFLHQLFIDQSILENTSIDNMTEWIAIKPQAIPIGDGFIANYGYGIMKLNYKGKEYIGHYGGTLKYQSFLFFNTIEEVSIVAVTNCAGKHYNNAFFQVLIPSILDEL